MYSTTWMVLSYYMHLYIIEAEKCTFIQCMCYGKSYQLTFADSTLTVDNLLRVMKKVTSDEGNRMKVWERVLEWENYNPCYYLDEVESKYTTAREKTNVLADVYINSHPKPSWEYVVGELYCCYEMAAAKEAKTFLQKNGEEFYDCES